LQRNAFFFDYLLLSRIFLYLTANNLIFLLDNMLLSQFFEDLAADYLCFLRKMGRIAYFCRQNKADVFPTAHRAALSRGLQGLPNPYLGREASLHIEAMSVS
jgi:hypothetical protein